MVYSLAVNHGSPQQARARASLLSTDWLHLDTLRNKRPSPFTVSKRRSGQLPPSDGAPQNTSTTAFNLPFCGQAVLTTFGFSDALFLILLCLQFPLDSANFLTSFFDSGGHMALQGWVLIEEPLNCSDMLRVYYPTVNLIMFALGLDLWGNECQMKRGLYGDDVLTRFASLYKLKSAA